MSAWREKYKVHPAADVFPMMSDEELADGADIKNRGVIEPVKFRGDWLLDGRNRLEAAERAGVDIGPPAHLPGVDPVSYVISANLHRRHLSKQARAELIVALAKLDQVDPYPEGVAGGRGKTSPIKARAIEINGALPAGQRVSEPTIKRAIAKTRERVKVGRSGPSDRKADLASERAAPAAGEGSALKEARDAAALSRVARHLAPDSGRRSALLPRDRGAPRRRRRGGDAARR